jgi:hypothetical protein
MYFIGNDFTKEEAERFWEIVYNKDRFVIAEKN